MDGVVDEKVTQNSAMGTTHLCGENGWPDSRATSETMFNFRGVHECALGDGVLPIEDASLRPPEIQARLAALKAALADAVWPAACPWIGTDAWLLRQIDRVTILEREVRCWLSSLNATHPSRACKGPWRDADGTPVGPLNELDFVRDCLGWRAANGVNDILSTFPADPDAAQLLREWPLQVHGVDRRGVPVLVERVALLSPKPLMARYPTELAIRFAIYSREWIAKQVFEASRGLHSRYVYVLSAAGIGLRHSHSPLFDLLDSVVKLDERYYVCSLSAYFVIQAPWLFSVLKSLLKVFVASELLERIVVRHRDWLEPMSAIIDIAHVPRGTRWKSGVFFPARFVSLALC